MSITQRLLLLAAVLPVLACRDPVLERRAQELEKRVANLEARQAEDEKWKGMVQTSLDALHFRLLGIEDDNEAVVDCTEKGYAFAPTQLGKLLVACEDLRPFGDGYRVVLRIGNPHSVALLGVKLAVRYGQRPPGTQPASDGQAGAVQVVSWSAWNQSLREKETNVTETLRPGSWNRVDIVVAPAKAEDVGFIGVKVQVDRVSLQR